MAHLPGRVVRHTAAQCHSILHQKMVFHHGSDRPIVPNETSIQVFCVDSGDDASSLREFFVVVAVHYEWADARETDHDPPPKAKHQNVVRDHVSHGSPNEWIRFYRHQTTEGYTLSHMALARVNDDVSVHCPVHMFSRGVQAASTSCFPNHQHRHPKIHRHPTAIPNNPDVHLVRGANRSSAHHLAHVLGACLSRQKEGVRLLSVASSSRTADRSDDAR